GQDGGGQHHEERQYGQINVITIALYGKYFDDHAEQHQVHGRSHEISREKKEIREVKPHVDESGVGGPILGDDQSAALQQQIATNVPTRLLTNADLEKMVETSDKWIVERTGIRQRHIVDQGIATSDLSVEAARKALAQRGLKPSDFEAVIVATVTPDMLFPSTA